MTLRMVKAVLAGSAPPYGLAELQALARHCTQREDAAQKVERRIRKSDAALLLSSRLGQRFESIVTGRTPSSTFVRIFKPPVEGMLVGRHADLDVGETLHVALVATDVERGFIDFLRRLKRAAPMKIKTILTDNGSLFTDRFTSKARTRSGQHVFDLACASLGIEHRLCPPRHPQTNGVVERFNGRISDIVNQTRFTSAVELDATLTHCRNLTLAWTSGTCRAGPARHCLCASPG